MFQLLPAWPGFLYIGLIQIPVSSSFHPQTIPHPLPSMTSATVSAHPLPLSSENAHSLDRSTQPHSATTPHSQHVMLLG